MEKYWPVPNTKGVASFGTLDRRRTRHTVVDIYAPLGSKVIAILEKTTSPIESYKIFTSTIKIKKKEKDYSLLNCT